MALPPFIFLQPETLKEASIMLAEHKDKARILAGGTDLLIRMHHRVIQPAFIISLRAIPDINHIVFNHRKHASIGATVKLASVAGHLKIQSYFPALAHAASVTATVQIRNMGTVVGNICNASPAADTATSLLVYDASVVIIHPGGERTLPLAGFFRGPGSTALEQGELVKEILLPIPQGRTGSNYQKLSARSNVDIAAIGVSSLLTLDDSGKVCMARIAIGAVAPVPKRVFHAEKSLETKMATKEAIAAAAAIAAEEATPITDLRATASYRKTMVEVLTRRALEISREIALQKKPETGI
jgi:carbon-monoxide dehydrogenase medium subunit